MKYRKQRLISCKRYCAKNKEKIKLRHKKYYQKNKKRIQAYKKQWQIANNSRIRKKQKIYRLIHKEERRQYENNRKKIDVNYKILGNLRSRLYYALKNQRAIASDHGEKLIGCSINKLKQNISMKFLPGMTFANYGKGKQKWSIDHVVPCSFFDLKKPKQQRQCFHYTNLMPLWNEDNFKKNSLHNGYYIRKSRKE
jgi:hypothetical protein